MCALKCCECALQNEEDCCNSLPQVRNEKCEELRLELDAKRREAASMAGEDGGKDKTT